jgi:hypothetical protein
MSVVSQALIHKYARERAEQGSVDAETVANLLCDQADLDSTQALAQMLSSKQPDWVLDNFTFAVLASVDDCMTLIFNITQMAPHVDDQLRKLKPRIAASLLAQPDLPLTKEPDLFNTLDVLNRGMVGWTEGLGAGSNKLKSVFDDAIEQLVQGGSDLSALHAELARFMKKESDKIRRLEDRLAASETGIVRSKQAKVLAANLINDKTVGKLITESLGTFLRGPWNDSLQLLVNAKGIDSEEWQRASALTETILWTYQPIDEEDEQAAQTKQKLYRIIEHLPGEVKELLVALEHNTHATESALETLENEQVTIVSGISPEYVEFESIPSESTEVHSTVSRVLLRKVQELTPGQWFSYTDGDQVKLIKLVLKLDDVKQLLFTNRNGMKVMQKSFDEFAYYISSHVVRVINPEAAFSSTFKTYYQGMIDELKKHRQLINDRKAEVDRLDEERKQAQKKALAEAQKLAIDKEEAEQARAAALKAAQLEHAKAEASKLENADRLEEFTQVVASLAAGAEVLLPDALGEKQICKLAVKIAAADKFIFVDRDGMKAGDYNAEQLVQLLVAGQAELGESGVEFEDTLASVVSKLRSDREKSYDDLTGK